MLGSTIHVCISVQLVSFQIHQENSHQEVFSETILADSLSYVVVLLVPKDQILEPHQDFLKRAYLFF